MKFLCKNCNTEIEVTQPNKGKSCGCDNDTYIRLDKNGNAIIQANDFTLVQIVAQSPVKSYNKYVPKSSKTPAKKRKVRKLDYEVR